MIVIIIIIIIVKYKTESESGGENPGHSFSLAHASNASIANEVIKFYLML
jgi:hypothetical protein